MNAADQAISFARAQIGKPYVFGGIGPNGYDCSGLIQTAYRTAGITLPRVTQAMVFSGNAVAKEQLQAGDLVFPDLGHVQLYVGNGQVIEAQHTGTNVLQGPMWGFQYGRRVTSPGLNVINASVPGLLYDPRYPPDQIMPNGKMNGHGGPSGLDPALPGVGGLDNAIAGIGQIIDLLNGFSKFFSSGHNWIRAAEFLGGLLLLFLGIKGVQ